MGPWMAMAACSGAPEAPIGESLEPIGQVSYALGTVEDAVQAGCSTTSVKGLSLQIVAQTNCLIPNALAEVPDLANITFGSAAFPYLQTKARDALVATLNANQTKTLDINSMLRTVAQQYLLYRWYKAGSCGITLANSPGTSPHEGGLGFDTSDYSAWKTALQAHGWSWQGAGDAVHFTYTGGGTADLLGTDVLAFQMLWNLNHPADKIDEDGAYGTETETRLKKSPADGFPIPPDCNPNHPPKGNLDGASCEAVTGWAQDPDEPAKSIDVHIYFGGPSGDPNAKSSPLKADVNRADLCTALGSCEHGFSLSTPLSLHDGASHPIHAYGIDSAGGANAQLDKSPLSLKCAAQLPTGVLRHVTAQTVMTAWKFDPFWDLLPTSDAQLGGMEKWNDLEDTPVLVKADDGTPEVWLLDGTWRRHVPNPQVAKTWRLDLTTVKSQPAQQVYSHLAPLSQGDQLDGYNWA